MPDQLLPPDDAFRVLMSFNGNNISAVFSEVTGISSKIIAESRDDSDNVCNSYGKKFKKVTLKRGVIKGKDIQDWIILAHHEGLSARRKVIITLMGLTNERPVKCWSLQNAIPIKYTGPTLIAKGGTDVAMEELILCVEGITYDGD